MGKIGIIANPASGKDIRRLVGQALVVGNREKINIIKRILIGAYAAGVREMMIMPDSFRMGEQSLHDLKNQYAELVACVQIPKMSINDVASDSIQTAQRMCEWGVDCILILGGDGTVRVVSKGVGDVPLLPISTGTNNVIPEFIEGTIAGLAAGYFAILPASEKPRFLDRQKKLDVILNGQLVDSALVDIAVIAGQHVGSRAVWDLDQLLQVAVTRASPTNIGFSSIIGRYKLVRQDDPFGASVIIKEAGRCFQVQAAIGPGLIYDVCVDNYREMKPGEHINMVNERPAVVALDGEREIILKNDDQAEIVLNLDGPNFLNYRCVMENTMISNWN
jgi:predicted polyphosphate/ATP-dependent NAD kinase